jgi:hypothetical protein
MGGAHARRLSGCETFWAVVCFYKRVGKCVAVASNIATHFFFVYFPIEDQSGSSTGCPPFTTVG